MSARLSHPCLLRRQRRQLRWLEAHEPFLKYAHDVRIKQRRPQSRLVHPRAATATVVAAATTTTTITTTERGAQATSEALEAFPHDFGRFLARSSPTTTATAAAAAAGQAVAAVAHRKHQRIERRLHPQLEYLPLPSSERLQQSRRRPRGVWRAQASTAVGFDAGAVLAAAAVVTAVRALGGVAPQHQAKEGRRDKALLWHERVVRHPVHLQVPVAHGVVRGTRLAANTPTATATPIPTTTTAAAAASAADAEGPAAAAAAAAVEDHQGCCGLQLQQGGGVHPR